jgi:hypothetical protein
VARDLGRISARHSAVTSSAEQDKRVAPFCLVGEELPQLAGRQAADRFPQRGGVLLGPSDCRYGRAWAKAASSWPSGRRYGPAWAKADWLIPSSFSFMPPVVEVGLSETIE